MSDPDVRDSILPLTDDQLQHPDGVAESARLEVIPDPESDTVTFLSPRSDDDPTTAWLTADAGLLVDVSEMQ